MRVHVGLLVLLLVAISGCSSPREVPTSTILPSETAPPSSTPSPIPTTTSTSTTTPSPTITPSPTMLSPEDVFAVNPALVHQKSNVVVEILRVLIGKRDEIVQSNPQLANDHVEIAQRVFFSDDVSLGYVVLRITNNRNEPVEFFASDVLVAISGRQVALQESIENSTVFGDRIAYDLGPILPGITQTYGIWFGLGDLAIENINSMFLTLGSGYYQLADAYSWRPVGSFNSTIDLTSRVFEPVPDGMP